MGYLYVPFGGLDFLTVLNLFSPYYRLGKKHRFPMLFLNSYDCNMPQEFHLFYFILKFYIAQLLPKVVETLII